MRFHSLSRTLAWMILSCSLAMAAGVGGNNSVSDKKNTGKALDSGSLGIYVSGKRVGTETFVIEQLADSSRTKSEVKIDDGTSKATQTSEMELSPAGDLRRYAWNEVSPGKASMVVEPKDEYLIEHLLTGPTDKPVDQIFMLPHSTSILDDYFFAQREVLVWRYLGSGCRPEPGSAGCKLARAQFGVIIPRERASTLVAVEYVGREKVMVHGEARELNRFNLISDGPQWNLWLDDNYKLVRIVIASDNTEVVRD